MHVIEKNVCFHDLEELLELVHDILPEGFPDQVAVHFGLGLVDVHLSLIEANAESADHCLPTKLEPVFLLLVDLVANKVLATFDKDDFVYFVKLSVDHRLGLYPDWFQRLEDADHEVLVGLVVPLVVGVEDAFVAPMMDDTFLETKELPKVLKKDAEQKVRVDLALDLGW